MPLKTSHWISLFFTVVFAFFVVFSWHTYLVFNEQKEFLSTEKGLLSACEASLAESEIDKELVFEDESIREAAVDTFYQVFGANLNLYGNNANLAYYYIPFVMLVDRDGYYVNYTTIWDGNGADEYKQVTTDLNTWSEKYGSYIVSFQLDNYVRVISSTGEETSGYYSDVYEELSNPVDLVFMNNAAKFEAEKDEVIVSTTEEAINYYINTHNEFFNKYDLNYRFTAPTLDDDTVSRLLDEPSVISFAQGIQYHTSKGRINVYSITGSIYDLTRLYKIEDVGGYTYYHELNCTHVHHNEVGFIGTQEDCAKKGAVACPDCVLTLDGE